MLERAGNSTVCDINNRGPLCAAHRCHCRGSRPHASLTQARGRQWRKRWSCRWTAGSMATPRQGRRLCRAGRRQRCCVEATRRFTFLKHSAASIFRITDGSLETKNRPDGAPFQASRQIRDSSSDTAWLSTKPTVIRGTGHPRRGSGIGR